MAKQTKAPFDMDFTKLMADFKVPGVDLDAFAVAQRKNLEALTAANQCALEGFGALVRRQSEIARQSVEAASKVFGEVLAEGTPEEKVARQAEYFKSCYEQGLANAKELGDLAVKTQEEAAGLINARVVASFDEAKGLFAAKQ